MSSKRWVREHQRDLYVKRAKEDGYRSRAAYKLIEIDDKDKLLRPGMTVVDLGAAPGGWSQVVRERIGHRGKVIALDRLDMPAIPEVTFLQGDFTEEAVLAELLSMINNSPIDLVISDMAPNISGMKSIDQPRAMYLAELAFDFVQRVLAPGGSFLIKLFQGEGTDEYIKTLKCHFTQVKFRKPKASKPKSREVYALAIGYKLAT